MVLPVPLFIYITVASQTATVASLQRSLDSLSVLLGYELHSHGVPQTTGSPAVGGGQPVARGVGRWISPRASSLAGEKKAAPSSTLASSLRAEAEVGSCQTRSCDRATPGKQLCNNISSTAEQP